MAKVSKNEFFVQNILFVKFRNEYICAIKLKTKP